MSTHSLTEILQHIQEIGEFSDPAIGVNSRASDDDQPIHYACRIGNELWVRILLDAGADANSTGDMGRTPLDYAASFGHTGIVKLLLAAGANPELTNEFGRSPLDNAASDSIRESILSAIRERR